MNNPVTALVLLREQIIWKVAYADIVVCCLALVNYDVLEVRLPVFIHSMAVSLILDSLVTW
jgi:hypothetical protein